MQSIKWLLSLLSLDFIMFGALLRHTYNKIKHNMNNIYPDVCCIKKERTEMFCFTSNHSTQSHRLQDTFVEVWSCHIVQANSLLEILLVDPKNIFFLSQSRNNVAKWCEPHLLTIHVQVKCEMSSHKDMLNYEPYILFNIV